MFKQVPAGFDKPVARTRQNLYLWWRVRVSTGTGTGCPGKPQGCPWHSLDPNEVSDPVKFMAYLYPFGVERKKPKKEPQFRLPSIDNSIVLIEKLKREYEPVRNKRKGIKRLIKEDAMCLRQQWHDKFIDILQGTKEELPPLREVNHEINLIDPNKKYTHRLPRCPVMSPRCV